MNPNQDSLTPEEARALHSEIPSVVIFLGTKDLLSAVCRESASAALPNPTTEEFYINLGKNFFRALIISIGGGVVAGGIMGAPGGPATILGGMILGGVEGATLVPTAAAIDSGLQLALTNGAALGNLITAPENEKLSAELKLVVAACGGAVAGSLSAAGIKLSTLRYPSIPPALGSVAKRTLGLSDNAALLRIPDQLASEVLRLIQTSNASSGSMASRSLSSVLTHSAGSNVTHALPKLVDFDPEPGIQHLLRLVEKTSEKGPLVELTHRIFLLTKYDPESAKRLIQRDRADAVIMVGKPRKSLPPIETNLEKVSDWRPMFPGFFFESFGLYRQLLNLFPGSSTFRFKKGLFEYAKDLSLQGTDLEQLTSHVILDDSVIPGGRLLRHYPPQAERGNTHSDGVLVWAYPIQGPGPTIEIGRTGNRPNLPRHLVAPSQFLSIMKGHVMHSSSAHKRERVVYLGNEPTREKP